MASVAGNNTLPIYINGHQPFPDNAISHHEVSAWRTQTFLRGLREGHHESMALNLFLESSLVLVTYFMLPSVKSTIARFSFFGLSASLQLLIIATCRSSNPTVGFLIGFLSAWNILWSAVLLLFHDVKRQFKKIQCDKESSWQAFPSAWIARLGWTLDLVLNSRGIGWDWKVSGTPSRPPLVESKLRRIELASARKEDKPTSTGRRRYDTRRQALTHYITMLIVGYLAMDVLKMFVNHDPYFWGISGVPAPQHFPSFLRESFVLTKIYRQAVSLGFIWLALRTSFAMVPIGYLLLSSGTNAESWMYPDQFGLYSTVLDRGLAGFWGGWWHQLFRFGFQSASRCVTRDVLRMKKGSQLAALVELLTSFYLSGFMHLAASYTMIGDTSPWWKMFFFFAIQPAGVVFELVTGHFLYLALRKVLPRTILRYASMAGHFCFAHVWLYLTLPYLVEDLARGGLFLAEPSPFSPCRALGLGVAGDTSYPWRDAYARWQWGGSKWWLSGFVL